MNALLRNEPLVFAARIVVGTLFVISGVTKAGDPAAFAALINHYQLLPHSVNLFIASVLPWTELVCGLALVFGPSFRGASLLLGSLTVVFTLAVVSGIARDLDITCGCFTLDPEAARIGWQKVAENTALIVLCAFLVFTRTDGLHLIITTGDADHSR